MAILSDIKSTSWILTFNENPGTINIANVTVSSNTVTSITGMGTTRTLIVGTQVSDLEISDITITGLPSSVELIDIENRILSGFLAQIRSILNISLTKTDLPDDKIVSPFLRSADNAVLAELDLTTQAYAAKSDSFKEKARLSVLYRTAAFLVPSLPDIVEEAILNERTRYVEYDPDQKIAYFIRLSKNEIQDLLPPGTVTGSGVPIKTIRKCRVLF